MNAQIIETRSTRRYWILFVVTFPLCLAAYFSANYWAKIARSPAAETHPKPKHSDIDGLIVPLSALQIGEVWEEKNSRCRLPITNRTTKLVTILEFQTSCTCVGVEPAALEIGPGETVEVCITLDLTRRSPFELGQSKRAIRQSIMPITDRQKRPVGEGWMVEGLVRSRVTVDSLFLHFGETPIQGQTAVIRKIRATTHVPVKQLEVVAQPAIVKVQVEAVPGSEGHFNVLVSPDPALPLGAFSSSLAITGVTPEGERFHGVTIPVAGVVQPPVRLIPARMYLGTKEIGGATEAILVVQMPPGSTWAVHHIEVDSPNVTVEPVPAEGIPSGQAYLVKQQITAAGDESSKVRFFFTRPDKTLEKVEMEISASGRPRKCE